jgi:NAD(P)-dependent dehydrogenase (short-subunit alcohol dehydrogenase family)
VRRRRHSYHCTHHTDIQESRNEDCADQTALGRVGEPQEVGGVIAALLSEENRWINAQNIEAAGGYII